MKFKSFAIAGVPLVLVLGVFVVTQAKSDPPKKPADDVEVLPMQPVEPEDVKPSDKNGQPPRKIAQGGRDNVQFAKNAFPPALPDTDWHREGWKRNDCMRCHETGVANAPQVQHQGLPDILFTAKCRSCHVLIPGLLPRSQREPGYKAPGTDSRFNANAFPPMMPNSESHKNAWIKDDCLLCHQSGIQGAPLIMHKDLPPILLEAKCRSCHVQVRAIEREPVRKKVGR
ncbi:MAG: hypothetical protein DHS20C16_25010 [Phycisphaerae bacterium]|nr:MAG: hypothetical protein DHS20C16_25010 [Phycisphaerae bacterium]